MGLVVWVDFAPEDGGVVYVEGESRVGRLQCAENVQQRRREAADRAGRFAGGCAEVGALHREIGSEDQGIGVEDDDPPWLFGRIAVRLRERRHFGLLFGYGSVG